MVDKIEEMYETTQKLNVELMAEGDKEMTLEEPMVQQMHKHEQQKEKIRQKNEQMQLILQHFNIMSLVLGRILCRVPLHMTLRSTC